MATEAQERTLQDILTALGGGGGAAATEATLLAVKTATEATALALQPGGDTQAVLVSLFTGQSDGSQLSRCMGIYNNITQKQVKVDPGGELVTIDFAHHEIHDGSHFDCGHYDSDVDTGAPKYFLIKVGAAKAAHMALEMESDSSGGLWEIYKTPTTTADGSSLAANCTNDNIAPANTTTVFYDPTVTAPGTLVQVYFQGSANPSSRTGGSSGSRHERVLKLSTNYLVKFTSAADNTKACIRFWWYEHS